MLSILSKINFTLLFGNTVKIDSVLTSIRAHIEDLICTLAHIHINQFPMRFRIYLISETKKKGSNDKMFLIIVDIKNLKCCGFL